VVDGIAEDAAQMLASEISTLDDGTAAVGAVTTVVGLEGFLKEHVDGIVIVTGVSGFVDSDWYEMDVNRSRLQRRGATVLVLDLASIEHLENQAPNFASWIGGNIWHLVKARPLDKILTEQRLVALRGWSGLGDLDIVRLAESGKLPPDPEYAEWLTLLGRGELLGQRSQ
jgi:hypothetical protein